MVLKSDISSYKINWIENIKDQGTTDELGLGLDSFVFGMILL